MVMMEARAKFALAAAFAILAVAGVVFIGTGNGAAVNGTASNATLNGNESHVMQVVAAENFWGSLAEQICGIHCNVTSVITDPNTDPHEYEANSAVAQKIANANLVIVNGVGYDNWALKLISAGGNPNRTVLNAGEIAGVSNGSNPHLWYSPIYVNETVRQMYEYFVKEDPSNAAYYARQYAALNASLVQVDGRIAAIKRQYAGTKVASTEEIFVYLANASGLDLISPMEFMSAVSEGTDPSIQSVTQFENQLENRNVSVLVYNEQTTTPLTVQMREIAMQNNISVVGVTETIQPQDMPYQEWMNSELINLQNALNASVHNR